LAYQRREGGIGHVASTKVARGHARAARAAQERASEAASAGFSPAAASAQSLRSDLRYWSTGPDIRAATLPLLFRCSILPEWCRLPWGCCPVR
jgi:hypothetical protein